MPFILSFQFGKTCVEKASSLNLVPQVQIVLCDLISGAGILWKASPFNWMSQVWIVLCDLISETGIMWKASFFIQVPEV